jgi:hypothetical protein
MNLGGSGEGDTGARAMYKSQENRKPFFIPFLGQHLSLLPSVIVVLIWFVTIFTIPRLWLKFIQKLPPTDDSAEPPPYLSPYFHLRPTIPDQSVRYDNTVRR